MVFAYLGSVSKMTVGNRPSGVEFRNDKQAESKDLSHEN
jgi:hypothetical protein